MMLGAFVERLRGPRRPHYLGDAGTWTMRGPLSVVHPYPWPPGNGSPIIYNRMLGAFALLGATQPIPGPPINQTPQITEMPVNAQIGAFGQAYQYYGNGG